MCDACGGGSESLGNSAKSVRGRWYALQDTAARLVPKERVSLCMRRPSSGGVAVLMGADGRARYDGLQTCGSVWLCPICGRRISEFRRREVNQVLSWARAWGHDVRMVTLTLRHYDGPGLKPYLIQLRDAKRRWRRLRAVDRFWRDNVIGSITALEITVGVNGWHPHIHMIVVCRSGTGDQLWGLAGAWLQALSSEGGSGNDHAYDVGDSDAVGDYVTKWGPGEELTSTSLKSGGGRSPWRLLEDAQAGDLDAAGLWIEYASVMKGRRQLVWSPGLRAAAGLGEEMADYEIPDVVVGPEQALGIIERHVWNRVVLWGLRAWILEEIERGARFDDLCWYVERHPVGAWRPPDIESEGYQALHWVEAAPVNRLDRGVVYRAL